MADNSTDTTTTTAQFTNTAQQQQQDSTTTPVMTEDDGFKNNSPGATETTPAETTTEAPVEPTTTTSITEPTTNSPTVPEETAIATTIEASLPPPPPEPTTTQTVATTTAEAPSQTYQPAPTEPIATEATPTTPIATPYVESIYSAPTMIPPGVVSSSSATSAGLPISSSVNTVATPSATTTSCIPSNENSSCATADLASNTMSSGQIAGIAVGAIAFVSLLGACLFITMRRRRRNADNYRNQSGKKVSPFFLMANDQEKQSNNGGSENNSRAVLYQGTPPESQTPEMSESVYGDNIFYSDSADYRRTSSIMNVNNTQSKHGYLPHSKDSQLDIPATSLYPHSARRYDSYSSSESTIVMNSKAKPYYATATSAQLHQKSPMNQQQQQQQQQGRLPYIQSARSSGEIDVDNYTLSAMQFRDSRQTTTTTGTRSMVSSSIMGDDMKIYRPSLNHSSVFHHSPSSSMDSSSTMGHPMISGPPPSSLRFSHHRRQESSLDPHILPSMQQKMSLWDDNL